MQLAGVGLEIAEWVPFDGKSSNSRLFGKNVAPDAIHDGFGGWFGIELVAIVLVVDIVAHAYELSPIVAAGKEDHCYTQDLRSRNPLEIRSVGFKDKFVDADGDGADEERVKLLVVLRSFYREMRKQEVLG